MAAKKPLIWDATNKCWAEAQLASSDLSDASTIAIGPGVSVAGHMALWASTDGKTLIDGGPSPMGGFNCGGAEAATRTDGGFNMGGAW